MDPVLLTHPEGEVITDRPGRRLVIKADTPELCVTETLHGPGEEGTAPHFHKLHSDAFYVLEGELMVMVAGVEHVLRPGGFALAPPNVVHCFENRSDGEVRFLNFHAPAAGFADYLRASARGHREAMKAFDSYLAQEL